MRIGYARCSTKTQDLTAQRRQLEKLGVEPDRIYADQGFTGTRRQRPGLAQALAATRAGDILVVAKLDRLARSVKDATQIVDELHARQVGLQIGISTYNADDPVGKLLFHVLAMVAEFEADLISQRTREGLETARSKGRLRGRRSRYSEKQQRQICKWLDSGEYTQGEIAELMNCHRSTISRIARNQRTMKTGAP